jgi:aryl-alcohol dehydrogenase-like predicted oxidoreductase
MMVSTVALGGAGNYGDSSSKTAKDDPAGYEAMMERLIDMGVNYFDTSQDSVITGTGGYATEENFAYLCTPSIRDSVFISTKIQDLDNAHAKQCVEAALTAMNTDYIDIVYIHNATVVSGAELGCFDAIDEMIAQGKVRYKGMTSHLPSALTGLLQDHADRADAVIGFCVPTDTQWAWANGSTVAQWNAVQALAKEKNVGMVAMKVFMSAVDPWDTRVSKIKSDAAGWARLKPYVDAGATIPQACVKWALSNENVQTAVLGMRTVAEAEEDAASVEPDGGQSGTLPSRTARAGIAVHSSPNPFAESTTVQFGFEHPVPGVHAAIYSPSGLLVRSMTCRCDERQCSMRWDGRNQIGQRVAAGRYVMVATVGRQTLTEPLVLRR